MKFTSAISSERFPFSKNKFLISCTVVFFAFWTTTFIGTTDLANWLLENTLVVIFLTILVTTHNKFQFSDLSSLLIIIFLILHVYGAKYTYAENPLGYWLQNMTGTSRNHYDRIVHFSFGFLLAYPVRELFLVGFRFPKWFSWILPIGVTLSFSSFYEIVEWAVAALFFPEQGISYLGTQGDIWDAQKDISLAFIGAILGSTMVYFFRKLPI